MSREALEVRRMQEEDLDAAAAIEQTLFSKPWSRESLAGAIKMQGNLYLSAFWDGQLPATVVCGVLSKKEISRMWLWPNPFAAEALLPECSPDLWRWPGKKGYPVSFWRYAPAISRLCACMRVWDFPPSEYGRIFTNARRGRRDYGKNIAAVLNGTRTFRKFPLY